MTYYNEAPGTATPGQKKLGRGMENKLGAGYYSDWDSFSQREARDRNSMLKSLRKCIADEKATVLRVTQEGTWVHWWWAMDPNREDTDILRLLS